MLYLYRVSKIEDFDFLLELKSQKDAVKWSGFDTAPDPQEFKRYFIDKILNDPNAYVYYLKDNKHDIPMGYIQFNRETDTIIEGRGTNILKCYQGCGLLGEMTVLMFEEAKKEGFKTMYTYASEKNIAALYNLQENGYIMTEEFELREMKGQEEKQKFYKWIKEL